jgi:tetratricopeptide (TPR) repeat protein
MRRWVRSLWIVGGVIPFLLFFGAACAGEIEEWMARADSLWPKRADFRYAREMTQLYEKVLEKDPQNVEALWKLARVYYWLGKHSPEDQKTTVFRKGVDYAKRAVELDDDCVDCHYWLGVCYGVYGEAKGVLKSLSLVDPIKEEMNRVIQLDPTYREGAAYRMLGRVAFKLPWFAGGSKKESLKYLKKALEVGPNSFLTHVFLAETYLAMKKRDLAKKELEWVLDAPPSDDPADEEDRQTARRLYEEHFAQ